MKEHTGLAVSSFYIAQVKQKYSIIKRENYNKPKSEDARQPAVPPELMSAFQLIPYQSAEDGVFKALGIE